MSRSFFFAVIILLVPSFVNAQQDLRDPSYIYYQEQPGVKCSIAFGYFKEDIAIIFKGQLYKNIDFDKFYADSSLAKYHGRHHFDRRKISKYTTDPDVKRLYVVKKLYSERKMKKIEAWRRSYPSKI